MSRTDYGQGCDCYQTVGLRLCDRVCNTMVDLFSFEQYKNDVRDMQH